MKLKFGIVLVIDKTTVGRSYFPQLMTQLWLRSPSMTHDVLEGEARRCWDPFIPMSYVTQ